MGAQQSHDHELFSVPTLANPPKRAKRVGRCRKALMLRMGKTPLEIELGMLGGDGGAGSVSGGGVGCIFGCCGMGTPLLAAAGLLVLVGGVGALFLGPSQFLSSCGTIELPRRLAHSALVRCVSPSGTNLARAESFGS